MHASRPLRLPENLGTASERHPDLTGTTGRWRGLFILPALLALVASASAAPPARVETETAGKHFLEGLAAAEKRHDYAPLLADCDRQVAARPDAVEPRRRRALARWGARQYDAALDDFGRAADLARRQKAPPRLLAILFYGRALVRREQHRTAAEAEELEHAAKADPGFTDALNDLAWIRATNPDASLRDGREAVRLARAACETVPGSVKYLDTLAAAYAEAGDARQALATEKAAYDAAHANARAAGEHREFLAAYEARVQLFKDGKPYHEEPAGS